MDGEAGRACGLLRSDEEAGLAGGALCTWAGWAGGVLCKEERAEGEAGLLAPALLGAAARDAGAGEGGLCLPGCRGCCSSPASLPLLEVARMESPSAVLPEPGWHLPALSRGAERGRAAVSGAPVGRSTLPRALLGRVHPEVELAELLLRPLGAAAAAGWLALAASRAAVGAKGDVGLLGRVPALGAGAEGGPRRCRGPVVGSGPGGGMAGGLRSSSWAASISMRDICKEGRRGGGLIVTVCNA